MKMSRRRLAWSTGLMIGLIGLGFGVTAFLRPIWTATQFIRLHLWQQGVSSDYAIIGGNRIHYYEAFPQHAGHDVPAKATIVLLHGLGGRGEDWSPMIPTLTAHGYHVIAPDLLGYGRSARPDVDYAMPLQASVVEHLLLQLRVNHAVVVGWSMGGWVAQTMALDEPETVDRLVLYDSAGVYFPVHFDPDDFAPRNRAEVERLYALLTPHPRHVPSFVVRDLVRGSEENGWVVRRSVLSMLTGRDLMDFRLREVQQPTLIVWGAADTLVPFGAAEVMHRLIANSTLVRIEGCGHLAPAECAGPVLHATLNFLAEKRPERSTTIVYPEHSNKPRRTMTQARASSLESRVSRQGTALETPTVPDRK
jgi:pimeloyl-ACP methyl ester carboxylesterase